MPLHRPDPAALGQDDGDRLLLDHCGPIDLAGRSLRRLQLRLSGVAELLPYRCQVAFEPRALTGWAFDQLREFVALLAESGALLRNLHLLKPAQGAQAHVEDRL